MGMDEWMDFDFFGMSPTQLFFIYIECDILRVTPLLFNNMLLFQYFSFTLHLSLYFECFILRVAPLPLNNILLVQYFSFPFHTFSGRISRIQHILLEYYNFYCIWSLSIHDVMCGGLFHLQLILLFIFRAQSLHHIHGLLASPVFLIDITIFLVLLFILVTFCTAFRVFFLVLDPVARLPISYFLPSLRCYPI